MVKLLSKWEIPKEGYIMAVNVTTRKDNVKNMRSHALNATKKRQNLNLQVYKLEDGTKVRLSTKEIRTLKKNEKAA